MDDSAPEWLADIRKRERETFVTYSISELREVLDMSTFARLIEIRRGKATDFKAAAGQELTHGSIIDVPVEFPPELTEQQIAELSSY